MNIGLKIFHDAFFEETAEHLSEMERLLIGLDLDAPEPDELNAIFRAAHSIKGNSGTFGFTDMTALTHRLESLLDRLRNGEIQPTREMVDVFLTATDALNGQLAEHRDGQIVDLTVATAVIQQLDEFLERLPSEFANPNPRESVDLPVTKTVENDSAPLHHWRLRFVLPVEAGQVLDGLMAEWAQHGEVSVIQRPVDGEAHPSWEIHLATHEGDGSIREDLAFYADPAQLQVDPLEPYDLHKTEKEDLGYGFFAPSDAPVAIAKTNDDLGFGFFDDAPGTPQPPDSHDPSMSSELSSASSTASTRPAVVPYGFFPNAPGAPGTVHKKSTEKNEALVTRKSEGNSIRVGVEKVDQIMNLVGELVIAQSMLAQVASQLDPASSIRLQTGLDQLERNTRNLQESVMSIRMMPISVVFSRFPRMVRDLATKLGKQVELITLGEGTELDKGLTEKLTDPITHLIRNSLDHGIEAPKARVALGKEPVGHITLSASHQGGNVVIEVRDDGAGLDRSRILAKARENNLAVTDSMSDQEIWQLIFAPGFSTAEQVTDVSGRGVGMDVVRRNIQEMGGTVEITSMRGMGSTFTVRLPLTLAILDGLSVAVGDEIFIISLGYIMESMRPRVEDIRSISGRGKVVLVRGEYLPILPLHEMFGLTPTVRAPEEGILVLLEAENRHIALFVDQLVSQHQVVIKSLESNFRRIDGISGATIMGDGRVALILDVGYLVRHVARTG